MVKNSFLYLVAANKQQQESGTMKLFALSLEAMTYWVVRPSTEEVYRPCAFA